MWSGLLPPGLNESDVDLSSDDGDEPRSSFSKEDARGGIEKAQLSEFQENGPESNAIGEPIVISVTDGENESQTCPSGISLDMWNKFVELQKKNREMKTQANQGTKSRKRKRHRKGVLYNYRIYFLKKSGLELSIEKSVAEGDIDKAEELSDRLAIRELGVKIAKAAACRNFVKAKQDAEAAQEARKKKKLAWGFEAKKRWETKSNMGYM
ncbi:protein FAM204A isoform 2-T6 [Morphnus guianensis]